MHFLQVVRNGLVKYILQIFLINLIGSWGRRLGQVFCDLFEPHIDKKQLQHQVAD